MSTRPGDGACWTVGCQETEGLQGYSKIKEPMQWAAVLHCQEAAFAPLDIIIVGQGEPRPPENDMSGKLILTFPSRLSRSACCTKHRQPFTIDVGQHDQVKSGTRARRCVRLPTHLCKFVLRRSRRCGRVRGTAAQAA